MKLKYSPLLFLFFLLALISCTKDKGVPRHSSQPEPNVGIAITIDTTWDGDTTINLKP